MYKRQPPNYQGAYEKARAAAGLKPKRKRVAALDGEDFDSDSDTDCEGDFELPDHLKALMAPNIGLTATSHVCGITRPQHTILVGGYGDANNSDPLISPTPMIASTTATQKTFEHPNKFAALDDNNGEDAVLKLADELNSWATVVRRKPKNSKATVVPKSSDGVVIRSERDLDAALNTHPQLAAIPPSNKKIRRIIRSLPEALKCKSNEILCLVDSGSTINAAWIEKHFPQYAHLVQPTAASRSGDFATTAGGQKLMNKGKCTIGATCLLYTSPSPRD